MELRLAVMVEGFPLVGGIRVGHAASPSPYAERLTRPFSQPEAVGQVVRLNPLILAVHRAPAGRQPIRADRPLHGMEAVAGSPGAVTIWR